MKNKLTKVICVLLSLVMLFGLSSITTSAAAEESAVSSTIPDGPNANGCFYLNGEKQHAYKLIAFDGAYYFVAENHMYVKDSLRYLNESHLAGSIFTKPGYYYFDTQGRLIDKNGPDENDYFYIKNERQKAYKLCEYNGDYYYVAENNKICKNATRSLSEAHLKGTPFKPGKFTFGADGKMILKNGPDRDGYFYINNVKQTAYSLKEYEGKYYYICEYNKYAVDQSRNLSSTAVAGTPFPAGKYDFDETGAMIIKNGPQEDGYFYLNGIRQRAFQLIYYEGYYYFVSNNHQYIRGRVAPVAANVVEGMTFPDGTPIAGGYYSFDEQGRMIINFVPIAGVSNTRDIGGYVTTEGKTIKKGMLLRGSELDGAVLKDNVITEHGRNKLLRTYGIKTEMDLRNKSVSKGDMLGEGVAHKYYNAPQYEQIFTVGGKAKMKEIFTDLSNPDNYPIYLHCSYGIDRTGTTCYILEAVLGLNETQLQSEFALSGWKYSYKQEYADKIKNGLNDYEGDTIRQRAVSYLLSCGITQQQIDTLRDIYLED